MKIKNSLRLILGLLLLGSEFMHLNYATRISEDSGLYRRIRINQAALDRLTIPAYLERHLRIKQAFLDKLRLKHIPLEYIKAAEEFRIMDRYKDYFEQLLVSSNLPEEIAERLTDLFVYDSGVALVFQSQTKERPKRILDLGSGKATYFRAFANLFEAFEAIVGVERESWVEEARENIAHFELKRLGKYIDVLQWDMFKLEENQTVLAYKPFDLITMLHPNIFAPVFNPLTGIREDIATLYKAGAYKETLSGNFR